MESIWLPVLFPRSSIAAESSNLRCHQINVKSKTICLPLDCSLEFGITPSLGSPNDDFNEWHRICSLRPLNPPANASDIRIDAICGGNIIKDYSIGSTHQIRNSSDIFTERLSHVASREKMTVVASVVAQRDLLFAPNSLDLFDSVASILSEIQQTNAAQITFLSDATPESNQRSDGSFNNPLTPQSEIGTGSDSSLTNASTDPSSISERIIIQIRGPREVVIAARRHVLILLDQCNGYACEGIETIPIFLHPAIAGPDNIRANEIMRECGVKIYFPSPLASHSNLPSSAPPNWENRIGSAGRTIYITGIHTNVVRAREMLREAAVEASAAVITATVSIIPRKMEWIILTQSEFVHSLMRRCGVFIALPPLGSPLSFATIYSTKSALLSKAVRDLAAAACEFHEVNLYLRPIPQTHQSFNSNYSNLNHSNEDFGHSRGNYDMSIVMKNSETMENSVLIQQDLDGSMQTNQEYLLYDVASFCSELAAVATNSGAEIVLKNNNIAIYGPQTVVGPALSAVLSCPQLQMQRNTVAVETEINIELSQKHEDFIRGKHCGKIKKLIGGSRVRYLFAESITESNIMLRLISPLKNETVNAYRMLTLELPVEMSLMIPERDHHRMIGFQGKNSQRLGTQYHAFLRFSNSTEQSKIGGYFRLCHNVFALTPAKYAGDLPRLLDELVTLYAQICSPQPQNSIGHGDSGTTYDNNRYNGRSEKSYQATNGQRSNQYNSFSFSNMKEALPNNEAPISPLTIHCIAVESSHILAILTELSEIEEKHEITIEVPSPDIGSELVYIYGTFDCISSALQEIACLMPDVLMVEYRTIQELAISDFNEDLTNLAALLWKEHKVVCSASISASRQIVAMRFSQRHQEPSSLLQCRDIATEYFTGRLIPEFDCADDLASKTNGFFPFLKFSDNAVEKNAKLPEYHGIQKKEYFRNTNDFRPFSMQNNTKNGVGRLPTPENQQDNYQDAFQQKSTFSSSVFGMHEMNESIAPKNYGAPRRRSRRRSSIIRSLWSNLQNTPQRSDNRHLKGANDLYDHMISPATAAELPFLASRNWEAENSACDLEPSQNSDPSRSESQGHSGRRRNSEKSPTPFSRFAHPKNIDAAHRFPRFRGRLPIHTEEESVARGIIDRTDSLNDGAWMQKTIKKNGSIGANESTLASMIASNREQIDVQNQADPKGISGRRLN